MRKYIFFLIIVSIMVFSCHKTGKEIKKEIVVKISIERAIKIKDIYCSQYLLNKDDYYEYPVVVNSFYIFHHKLPSKEKLAAEMGIWVDVNSGKCFSPYQNKINNANDK